MPPALMCSLLCSLLCCAESWESWHACSGNTTYEPGAVVCRMAHSWVRFGSFQLPAGLKEGDLTRQLADHVIRHHFSHLEGEHEASPL